MNIRIAALAAMTTLMGGAAMAAPSSPVFYGYECYNTREQLGWYSLMPDGLTDWIWTDHSGKTGIPMTAGWRRDGKLCGISSLLAEGKLYALNYLELNEADGSVITSRGIDVGPDDYLNYFMLAAYIPESDRVYGYGWSADGNQFVFKSSNYDITETKVIRIVGSDELCGSLTYSEETGKLVGFNRKSFVYIDPATGNQTEIFTPDLKDYQYSYTALAFEPDSGIYYWNVFTQGGKSHLYAVDLNAHTCKLICDYNDMTQFSFLIPANEKGDPEAPMAPSFEDADFGAGALSGTVSFKMPSTLVNGNTINGNLTWTATIDGEKAAEGEASPSTMIRFEAKDLSEGNHVFAVRATYADKTSRQGSRSIYVGHDTPATPENIVLKGTSLTWNPVEKGADGGYVNPSEISYTVYLNGKKQGETTSTSYTIAYPQGQPYSSYQASVTASYDGKTSEAGTSGIVKYGEPLSAPVDLAPTAAESDLFESTDALGGNAIWSYDGSTSGKENFTSPASQGKAIDSWLFMPPVATPDAEGVYEFSIRTALLDAAQADGTIEIMAGTSPEPEAMTTTIISPLDLTQTSLKEFKGLFTPASLGGADRVFIGVRVRSESGDYRVIARRFIVKTTDMKADVADAPLIESIEALPQGELKARLSIVFPEKYMNGEAIPASTKLTATIQCDYAKTTLEGTPGSKATGEIMTNQGENYITVTSAIAGRNGNYSRARVFTGMAVPAGIRNLRISIPADNMSCDLSWEAPEEALGEGYMDPSEVMYYYCTYNSSTGEYTPDTNLDKSTSYTIDAPSRIKLMNVNFAIQTRTAAGASPELEAATVQLGKPYTLPMTEIFYNPQTGKPTMSYSPYTILRSGDYEGTAWEIKDPSEINQQYAHEFPAALIGTGEAGTTGYIQLPKFSTSNINGKVGIEVTIYGEHTTPSLSVWGYAENQADPVEVGTISRYAYGQYQTYGLELPTSLQGQGWVTLYLTPQYDVEGQIIISNFRVDKGIGISLPTAEQNALTAAGGKGVLNLSGIGDVMVTTLDGRTLWMGHVEGSQSLRLSPALYIVTADGKSSKVLVK